MLAALVLGVAAVSGPPLPVSLERAVADLDVLDGKLVEIRGWLGRCEAFDCVMFASRTAELDFYKALRRPDDRHSTVWPPVLFIGSTPSFDRAARRLQHRPVVVVGRLCYSCRLSTDRADVLRPRSIHPSPQADPVRPRTTRKRA